MNSSITANENLDLIKESLLRQKSEILNKRAEFKESQSHQHIIAEEAEKASHDLSNTISIHLHERDQTSLLMIERALSRISDGTFGQCESCSEEIGVRRLQARPLTTLCVECMEEQETYLQ